MSITINGFNKYGIWPFNIIVFIKADFIASMTTDIPLNERSDLISNIIIRNEDAEPVQSSIEQIIDQIGDAQPTCLFCLFSNCQSNNKIRTRKRYFFFIN